MNTIQQMVFDVDRAGKKINVSRTFAAPLETVWEAWTKPEITDQWWAPKPWRAETKRMDFREGGQWLYAMIGPEGDRSWCRADFGTINDLKSFTVTDGFCDEDGKPDGSFPSMYWNVRFVPKGEDTTVDIEISFDAEEDLDKYIEMGFREGFTAALGNLDEVLAAGKGS